MKTIYTRDDVRKSFASEDGAHYRHYRQDISPTIRHVERMRKGKHAMGWKHVGSIPITMLTDWLKSRGYTMDQWARNDGGDRKVDPKGPGVKDQFMRYFLSRDFAKLHNTHVTTKSESSVFSVPKSIERRSVDLEGVIK